MKEVNDLIFKEIKKIEKIIKDKRKSESLTGKRDLNIEKYITSYRGIEFKKDISNFDFNGLNQIFKKELNKLNNTKID